MLKFSQVFSQKINAQVPTAEELERAQFRSKYGFLSVDHMTSVEVEKNEKISREVSDLAKRIRPNLMKVDFDYPAAGRKSVDVADNSPGPAIEFGWEVPSSTEIMNTCNQVMEIINFKNQFSGLYKSSSVDF